MDKKPKKRNAQPRKSTEFELYAVWLANSVAGRKEVFAKEIQAAKIPLDKFTGTDAQFAKMFNLGPTILSQWKQRPELFEKRDAMMFPELRAKTVHVLNGLARTAIRDGKAAEVNSFMKIVEKADVPDNATTIKVIFERHKPE
jgi:hypothetical protein